MLGYISSTRKKSCTACVKAKRRCDLGYPFCKRCFVKGLDCTYPNPRKTPVSVRDTEIVIRHTDTPPPRDTSQPATIASASAAANAATSVEPDCNFARDPWIVLRRDGESSESDEGSSLSSSPEVWMGHDNPLTARPPLRRTLLPTVVVPVLLNERQSTFVIEGLCSLVTSMACSGTTHFLHRNLFADHDQPVAYQDCVAISALYMAQNASYTGNILVNSINAKIAALVKEAPTWSLMQHLAAVQALIIYQIIRLFDPILGAQEQAVKHNVLLERWATSLFHRLCYDMPFFADERSRWVFTESLRRTLFMAVFTRCSWSVFTCGGLASQVHVLAGMPLTKDLGRWNQEENKALCQGESMQCQEQELISYVDMSVDWSHDKSVEELGSFGQLLLAPCRGRDDLRLLG
ncbi:hypothetical protein COCSADRAFT_86479 [Bipolaris sorokiniana ND90Pr]|uniref:Zn(2)-C6 fungal-type domain-containing protein n=1 Tax=Cochliobolus sativus (strain ND90Pr / ATCC 201652) TaxID=665912 RepID=M2T912_COCSN|nr:uncharacterized protein COCSADRAFT_86479 [Bipolaris sorokiniana ND90Pr]EMD65427.1 hypothetical protein COCSADRAFT_86479 [Bipolaris sorokiniana ND90Pr]